MILDVALRRQGCSMAASVRWKNARPNRTRCGSRGTRSPTFLHPPPRSWSREDRSSFCGSFSAHTEQGRLRQYSRHLDSHTRRICSTAMTFHGSIRRFSTIRSSRRPLGISACKHHLPGHGNSLGSFRALPIDAIPQYRFRVRLKIGLLYAA